MRDYSVALADFPGGKAIVVEPDGKRWALDTDHDEPYRAEGLHDGMYMPAETHPVQVDVHEEHPFADLHGKLQQGYIVGRAIWYFASSFDPGSEKEERIESAQLAEMLLANDAIFDAVRELFISKTPPAPLQADIGPKSGRAGEIFSEMLKKWK